LAHLLIIDLPDGNDTDLLQAAIARGDRYTFVSADLAAYHCQPAVQSLLDCARATIEVPGLVAATLAQRVMAIHASHPFDAVLCSPGSHRAHIAMLAQRLNGVFLNPETAALLHDPLQWQQRLDARGLPQHSPHGEGCACEASPGAIASRDSGRVIACDTFTERGRHRLLGVHDKLWHAAPSAALRGSTFTPHTRSPRASPDAIERYLGAVLDALQVDHGALHTELLITARGLQVASITAGLPGGRLPRLLGYALGRSLHADLIALHCGQPLPMGSGAAPQVAVLRAFTVEREGLLDEVVLPPWQDPAIRCVELLRQPGQRVRPPQTDADSLGCVMVCGPCRADAEDLADRYVARTLVHLRPTDEAHSAAPGLEFSGHPPVAATVRSWSPHPPLSLPPQPAPQKPTPGRSKAAH
jgi:hypothetical protein